MHYKEIYSETCIKTTPCFKRTLSAVISKRFVPCFLFPCSLFRQWEVDEVQKFRIPLVSDPNQSSPARPRFPAIVPTDREPGAGYFSSKTNPLLGRQDSYNNLTVPRGCPIVRTLILLISLSHLNINYLRTKFSAILDPANNPQHNFLNLIASNENSKHFFFPHVRRKSPSKQS